MINCIRCGLCLSSCPTYREGLIEPLSPRGRMELIRSFLEGELSPSSKLSFYIKSCLGCSACLAACPSGLKITQQIEKAKGRLGVNVLYRFLLVHLLPYPKRQEFLLRPFLSPLRPKLPSILPAKERRYRVGFFLGCLHNLLFPKNSTATLNILTENGCEVVIPKGIRCCGMPASIYGERKLAEELAEKNLIAFNDVEAIITDCATCGSFLKGYSDKVKDISEFLFSIGLKEGRKGIKKRVIFHHPCHLIWGQGIKEEPLRLLKLIPDLELIEIKGGCCGGAGSYFLHFPSLSKRILKRRVEDIARTGAEMLITSCPSCQFQLKRAGLKVAHLTTFLQKAYDLNREGAK